MDSEIKVKIKELRKSRKKPDFLVRESKFSGIKSRWRYPYGRHSAVRQRHKGRPALPHPGYGAPKIIFGLHYTGLNEVLVHNPLDLAKLDPMKDGAVISSTVGIKNKLKMLEAAKEKMIQVLNLKDIDAYTEKINNSLAEKKKAKRDKLKLKSSKLEEKKKKAERKEKKEKESAAKADTEEVGDKTKDVSSIGGEETVAEAAKKEERRLMEETITRRQ